MPNRDQAWLNAYEAKQRGRQFPNALRLGTPEDQEDELHAQIDRCIRQYGWAPIHSRMDKKNTATPGAFDYIIGVHPKIILLVECKARDEKLKPKQRDLHAHWQKMGFETCVCWNLEEFWAYATRMGVGQ